MRFAEGAKETVELCFNLKKKNLVKNVAEECKGFNNYYQAFSLQHECTNYSSNKLGMDEKTRLGDNGSKYVLLW